MVAALRTHRGLIIRLTLAALVMAVYWNTFHHPFVELDDDDYIVETPQVKEGLTGDGIAWAFTTFHVANWHPLTWMSWMLDAELQRRLGPLYAVFFTADANLLFPGGFHFTNVCLHALNVLLLFGVLQRMTGAVWRSALVAALFAVHPLHVESVAWVAERKDVLSMCFALLTLRTYLIFVRDRDLRSYLFMCGFFALALLSKAMVVTLPCLLLLLDFWPLARWSPRQPGGGRVLFKLVLEKIPLLAMAAVCSAITFKAQAGAGFLDDGVLMSAGMRLGNAVVSYVRYLGVMVWPARLAVLYPNPAYIGDPSWTPMQIGAAAIVLLFISSAAVVFGFKRMSQRFLITGWLWYLGTLVPVIGLVQIGRQSMADRYAYLPLIGMYVIVAWGLGELVARWHALKPVVLGMLGAALIALVIVAHLQVKHWRSGEALFNHTLAVTERNWVVHNNYAFILENQGRLDEALAHMLKAVEIYPEGAWLHHNLGTLYSLKFKRYYDAQREFERAIAISPNYAKAHHNLAVVLDARGDSARALTHYLRAAELAPDDAPIQKSTAVALASRGRYGEAIAYLEKARALEPDHKDDYDFLIGSLRERLPGGTPP